MTEEEMEASIAVERVTLLKALQELEDEGFIEEALARHGLFPRKPSSLGCVDDSVGSKQ
jgi:DNA-binding GntR family transcriptional regulator